MENLASCMQRLRETIADNARWPPSPQQDRELPVEPPVYLRYGKQIADYLQISERTFYYWQKVVPLRGKIFTEQEIDQWRQELNQHFAKTGRRRRP